MNDQDYMNDQYIEDDYSEEDEMSFTFDNSMFSESQSETEEAIEEENPFANNKIQTVTGIGINSFYNDEEQTQSLDDLIKNLNANNTALVEEENNKLLEEQRLREDEDRRIREEAQAQRLKQIAEEERLAREKIEQERLEEERRLAEELEAKRKANPLFRLKDVAANVANNMVTKASDLKAQREEAAALAKEQKQNSEDKEKITKEKVTKEAPQKKEKPVKPTKSAKTAKEKKQSKTESTPNNTPDFEYLATHDSLTKMKNVTAYDIDIQNKDVKSTAILFFDINDLKEVNDTMGHSVGNRLITTVANEIEKLFPGCGYRIGGDEFIVLLPVKKKSVAQAFIEGKIESFRVAMKEASQSDPDRLSYSASIGFAIGQDGQSMEELKQEADMAMYANKKAYKQKNEKAKEKKKKPTEEKKAPVDHDSLLSREQKMLKGVIQDNHTHVSEESTEKILREIQMHYDDIIAILIASPSFDHLFVIQSVDVFLNLVADMSDLIDYSYLYVVYENGTQFYGVDEYFDEVTELFKEIGNIVKTAPYVSEKELLKIKGINIFKQIYID